MLLALQSDHDMAIMTVMKTEPVSSCLDCNWKYRN